MADVRSVVAGGVALVVLAGAIGAGIAYPKLRLGVPTYPPVGRVVWLDQNWGEDERTLFHHVGQGTQTLFMPYRWFVSLEQPELTVGAAGLFSDQAFLDRYGFIPDDHHEADGIALPIGFARGLALTDPATGALWTDPVTGQPLDGIGFTCAACHTGRLAYKGTTIAIDGAGAATDIGAFQKALGLALLYTRYVPGRFARFVDRVLGPGATDAAQATMRGELDQILAALKVVQDSDKRVAAQSVVEGIGRLDALSRIGNQVFALDLQRPQNYVATSAPVRYPQVWGSSWFDWVQYNGSIEQPMVRNAGEALGVRALVNLTGPRPLFDSTVRVDNLFAIEQMLAGTAEPQAACSAAPVPAPATARRGLRAPAWPETLLPAIDRVKAARGATLYGSLCQGCHLPPIDSTAFCAPEHWTTPNAFGKSFVKLPLIGMETIGTDPAEAADMQARTVDVPPDVGLTNVSFGPALGQVVAKTVDHWYDAQQPPVPVAERDRMNGYRDNGIRAKLAYRPRPLDGIWAVAPYLHNGAVPSLYALLSPVAERPARVPLGRREFDPVTVGVAAIPVVDGFTLDTTLRGNANTGHEFADRPGAPGVIGRLLSPDERLDLVEYLKTL